MQHETSHHIHMHEEEDHHGEADSAGEPDGDAPPAPATVAGQINGNDDAAVRSIVDELKKMMVAAPPYVNALVNLTGRDVTIKLLTPSSEPDKGLVLPAHAGGAARLVCTRTPALLKTMAVRPEPDEDEDGEPPPCYNAPIYSKPDDEYDEARIQVQLPKGVDLVGRIGAIVPLDVAMHLAAASTEKEDKGDRKPVPVYVAFPVANETYEVLVQWRATL